MDSIHVYLLANWEKAVFVESAVHELLEVTDN